jgi:hypothetical protein
MRPAFSSTRQAAAFALLLLLLLLAPALAGKKFLPPREETYSSIWWEYGDFPYMDSQIFREKGDMDIVFIGSSHIWAAFDTPAVQEQLGKELGRQAVVRTFGWGGPGFDELYFVAKDLLEHRRVRMLVIDDGFDKLDQPHVLASRMFRLGDDAETLKGLSPQIQAAYHFASVAGLPRNLVSLARTNLPADMNAPNYWESRSHAANFAAHLGTFKARSGFRENPTAEPEPFVEYAPQTGTSSSDVCIFSPGTKNNFGFAESGLPPTQLHFAQKFAALMQEYGCKLVVLHIPTFDERKSVFISEPVFWPGVLHTDVTMIGIPPATMFRGLTDDEIRELYSDSVHLNGNGQSYFSSLMTPALLKIYESPIQNP